MRSHSQPPIKRGRTLLMLPPLSKALLGTLFIALAVQHPSQAVERMSVLRGHCQHPFIERSGLAEFAQVAQDRRESCHSCSMLWGVL